MSTAGLNRISFDALVATRKKEARMSWINLAALNYALEYDAESKDQRIVLFELAYHSDDRGYTWPSTKGIAIRWRMDRETVRSQIKALIVKRAIFHTKKRRGDTRQIKVYRMPKFTWASGSQTAPLSGGEETAKGRQRGGEGVAKPPRTRNKEEGTKNNPEKRAKGNSLSSLGNGPLAGSLTSFLDSFSSSSKEEMQEPTWHDEIRGMYPGTTVDKDLKQIEEWARKKGKKVTRELVLNALNRNPPRKPGQSDGYVYHGKFIENKKANALAIKNPELLLTAKRAIRLGGRIEIL
jgi:hypothetical protein